MADPEPQKPSAVERFRCDSCGAQPRYDAASKMLRCDFCGTTRDVPVGASPIIEHDLFAGIESLPMGLGVEATKAARCKECGATVQFTEAKTATSCAFCGSSSVLVQDENRRLVRPESLVPFGIDKKQASDAFVSWLRKLWFRPNDLRALARVQELGGVYVPFWTYDAHVDSAWTAEAGYYYYVTEEYEATENGETVTKTREVRHTRWESAWGQRADDYDDVLVCASVGLPTDLADSLKSFDTAQLVPYAAGFLAGWQAEEYHIDLQAGFQHARAKMDADQERRCASDVPGDTQRALSVSSSYSNLTFKHVLLPIWIAAYRYRGEIYRFLVNGQTGEVQGKAPYSWAKIALAVLFVTLLIMTAVLLGNTSK